LSSAFPTVEAAYSSNGSSWTTISSDVSEITMNLREIVNGVGLATITLDNTGGKFFSSIWTPFAATTLKETGLYWYWRWKINGSGYWYGRMTGLAPHLDKSKETVTVTVNVMDEPLKNYYLTLLIAQDTLRNMIVNGCGEWGRVAGSTTQFTMGGVTYTVDTSTSGNGPVYVSPAGYDCSRTRIFAHDYIKDLLVAANDPTNLYYGWSGYVDSTVSPTAATIYIFKQAAKSYSSTLTYGTNISTIDFDENLLRSKNWIEYVGSLSRSEPPTIQGSTPSDPWTEPSGLAYWSANPGKVSVSTTHYCPVIGAEVRNTPCEASIYDSNGNQLSYYVVDSGAIYGVGNPNLKLDFNLAAALGENYNALWRNTTSLNFWYKQIGGGLPAATPSSVVCLKDANGMIIQSNAFVSLHDTSTQAIRNARPVTWASYSIPVGAAAQYFVSLGSPTNQLQYTAFWVPTSLSLNGVANFDWSNITNIIWNMTPGIDQSQLWIDHLYFAQSYQPVKYSSDNDAIDAYRQRMQYYNASMYPTDEALGLFASARTSTLSPPLMQLDLLTSLGPEAEGAKGFQPGYCFPAGNVNVTNYGFQQVAWRAVEVETNVKVDKEKGCTTRFKLVPASGPGIGVNPARFDPRRNW
jgi:hypothetical protein